MFDAEFCVGDNGVGGSFSSSGKNSLEMGAFMPKIRVFSGLKQPVGLNYVKFLKTPHFTLLSKLSLIASSL